MSIYEQLQQTFAERIGDIITAKEAKALLTSLYGTNPGSVILSDYCYNRYNNGIRFDKHLFIYLDRNMYRYVGAHYDYNGMIYHRAKGQAEEVVVGEWRMGQPFLYDDQAALTSQRVRVLYEHYIEILRFEMNVLGCAATELRHLTGRLGEFLCVLHKEGELASETNQRGYDVIANGRRISVKTTAQENGFITVNANTLDQFDDLFVVQFKDGAFQVIYDGDKSVVTTARTYGHTYEIDIKRLKKQKTSGV